jgi:hypothetical protein
MTAKQRMILTTEIERRGEALQRSDSLFPPRSPGQSNLQERRQPTSRWRVLNQSRDGQNGRECDGILQKSFLVETLGCLVPYRAHQLTKARHSRRGSKPQPLRCHNTSRHSIEDSAQSSAFDSRRQRFRATQGRNRNEIEAPFLLPPRQSTSLHSRTAAIEQTRRRVNCDSPIRR